MEALKELTLHGNCLENPPQDVCEKGLEGLQTFLAQERKIRRSATKVRVFIHMKCMCGTLNFSLEKT